MNDNKIVRTMSLPVAEVIEGGTKGEFYRDLRQTLYQCMTAYNLSMSISFAKDTISASQGIVDTGKIPKCEKIYNYNHLTPLFPGNSSIAATIDRDAIKKYRQERFNILRGKKSLPQQRSYPFPVLHNASVKTFELENDEQGNILLHLKLLSGTKYVVKLRGGSNYKYILDRVKFCIETDSYVDSKIWINKKNVATIGIACKITPKVNNDTDKNKFVVALGRNVFVSIIKQHSSIPFDITGDQVNKWQSERKRRQERFRQDRKSGVARKTLTKMQNKATIKYNNRLNTFMRSTAMQIIRHAMRKKVGIIEYDATIKSYFGRDFPYFQFAKILEDKCVLYGIEFVKVTQDVVPAEADEPHIYFVMPVVNGKPDGRVKIGKTSQAKGKRKRSLETAGGCDLVVLATDKQPKTKLTQREKHYHSLFEKSRLEGQKEWFKSDEIIWFLRESGMLGNSDNAVEIQQYINL